MDVAFFEQIDLLFEVVVLLDEKLVHFEELFVGTVFGVVECILLRIESLAEFDQHGGAAFEHLSLLVFDHSK
jgi:hypothetical protein